MSIELTDEQVIARAAQAGFKWLPPDEEEGGFPGGFDMSDIDNMRKLLAASPADQVEDARDVAPLGEMVCGDVESTIDGYEVGDYELIYGKVLDDINVNHPGKVFTIYIDSAAISASKEEK